MAIAIAAAKRTGRAVVLTFHNLTRTGPIKVRQNMDDDPRQILERASVAAREAKQNREKEMQELAGATRLREAARRAIRGPDPETLEEKSGAWPTFGQYRMAFVAQIMDLARCLTESRIRLDDLVGQPATDSDRYAMIVMRKAIEGDADEVYRLLKEADLEENLGPEDAPFPKERRFIDDLERAGDEDYIGPVPLVVCQVENWFRRRLPGIILDESRTSAGSAFVEMFRDDPELKAYLEDPARRKRWKAEAEAFAERIAGTVPPDASQFFDTMNLEGSKAFKPSESDSYVTLVQMAAAVNRSKACLEKKKTQKPNPLPPPDIEGGGGRKDEWLWTRIVPWLEKEFKRPKGTIPMPKPLL